MKQRALYTLFALVLLFSMALTACQPTPPAAPAAPAEPTKAEVKQLYTEVPFAAKKVEAPNCDYGGNMKAIESTDASTVKFTLCKPDPAFLAKIAVPAFPILDTGYLEAMGGDSAKINDNPIGTGPYVVKEWVRGDHVTFVPNANYWGAAPKNQEFILKWNKEAAARLLDLQSGNVDGIANVGTDDIAAVKGDTKLGLYPRKFNNFLYMGLNNTIPPFDNEKVRQAFAMAVNKEQIVKDFYPEGASAAYQYLPPGVKPGYTDGFKGNEYKPEEAKKMLEEAGFDFTKEYTLSYAERTRPYFPQPTKIATALQANFAEIGVKIKLNMMEWAAYLPRTREGQEAIFLLGWSEDFPDATNWYDVFLMGSSKSFGTPYPDIMEQIKIGATNADPVVRQKAYDEVNKLVEQHVPSVQIANGVTFFAFKADTKGVLIGPYNENYTDMTTPSGRLVVSQDGEPVSLDCADETDGSSFTACLQIFNTLYDFTYGTSTLQPALAEKCEANTDGTEWTCTMRKGAKFSNGYAVDATDVVTSFGRMWNATDPLHKGNTGAFQYTKDFFGPKILNEPAS